MANIFITSDQHWGHAAILKFVAPDGKPLRNFPNVETMDEFMIDQWNSVVRPCDKVYHLGDVVYHKRYLSYLDRCNGSKRLVRGNHDDKAPTSVYLKYFKEIYGSRLIDKLLLTHIPVSDISIKPSWTNVHGHLHNNVPQHFLGPNYCNVCVEYTDYRPLTIEEVHQRIRKALEDWRHR